MSFQESLKHWARLAVLTGLGIVFFGACTTLTTWIFLKNQVIGRVVKVPDLYGLSGDEARARTESAGLTLIIDEARDVHSQVIARGDVLLQIPRPGRKVKSGREVVITLSAGPAQKRIPNLRGQTLNFSKNLLQQSELTVTTVSRSPTGKEPKGRVVNQHPGQGEELGLRAGVSLLISDGDQMKWYVMPDLKGRDYTTVKQFLDRNEFRVVTKYKVADPGLGQVILDQLPKAGYPIKKSENITLTVNKDF